MFIYTDIELSIDEEEIVRLLGAKNIQYNQEILDCIRKEISQCCNYIKPKIVWEKINIAKVDPGRIILENNVVLEGEFIAKKLSKCEYIIAIITTIGKDIDMIIKEVFHYGDYLKGMIIESIGIGALAYINKIFWLYMVEQIKDSNVGITPKLSPGDNKWEIGEQVKIFMCLKAASIGLTLTKSNMMRPIKSTSAIYGFGKDIDISKDSCACCECSIKNCNFKIL